MTDTMLHKTHTALLIATSTPINAHCARRQPQVSGERPGIAAGCARGVPGLLFATVFRQAISGHDAQDLSERKAPAGPQATIR